MRRLLRGAALLPLLIISAAGHGSMYEPPSRNSRGITFLTPGCPGGSCFWYTVGTNIGCDRPVAPSPCLEPALRRPCCDDPADPTLNDPSLRTYNVDNNSTCAWGKCGDWTRAMPWRKPGSAPVETACGIAGGAAPFECKGCRWFFGGGDAPPLARQGDLGVALPKLLQRTVWTAGGTAEVAWAFVANHGGGYSYRLCPAGPAPVTEACFQATPLDFVGDTQWIQWGQDGMDTTNRTEIRAHQVSVGTVPAGSQWRRNPIPACEGGVLGIGGGTDGVCNTPLYPPADTVGGGPWPPGGLFGFGLTGARQSLVSTVGIVDKVQVPDVPPGDYVVGFRWDCEQTGQVWQTCGDVTIKEDPAAATPPFARVSGCDVCCGAAACGNCTGCLNNKTGACAYCWEKATWLTDLLPAWMGKSPVTMSCLGHEAADGGPPYAGWAPGDFFHPERDGFLLSGMSPGCPKCWRDPEACTTRDRV